MIKKLCFAIAAVLLIVNCTRINYTRKQLTAFDSILVSSFPAAGPGASILVVKEGKLLYRKAFGMANIELAVPMDTNCLFRIGSITKQFTACAILRLAEEGKLALTDDITKYIPDYPEHGVHISIENLLTHTSGIESFTDMQEWNEKIQRQDFSPAGFIKWFQWKPLEFKPGDEFRYSNSGYFILGYIIEKLSGKTYASYLRDEFFIPLGLHHTTCDTTSAIIPARASGYNILNGKVVNSEYLSMTQAYSAGVLLSTTGDLYKWTKAVMAGRVISRESLQKAIKPFRLNNGKLTNYGFGWFLLNVNGIPTIEHGGGINGFTSYCLYLPSEDIFVALLTNCGAADIADLTVKLAAKAAGKPYNYKAIRMAYDSLIKYQGVYVNNEGDEAILRQKDSLLCGWIKGSKRLVFLPSANDRFFVRESFTYIQFSRDAKNAIDSMISYDRSAIIHWKRTLKPLPELIIVKVPISVMENDTGKYRLNDNFLINISIREHKLFVRGSGQSEFEIFPKSQFLYANEDGDILFEFNRNENGIVSRLKIFQNGRALIALRILSN